MPKIIDTNNEKIISGSSINYSRVRPEDLGDIASEFTLATLAVDLSGSVYSFHKDLEKAVKMVYEACKKSPRPENILVRLLGFNTDVFEIHGFVPVNNIDTSKFSLPMPHGGTALIDAHHNSIESTLDYAKDLIDSYYTVNGITFVITDGDDNSSILKANLIKTATDKALKDEKIESLLSILIGIDTASCKRYLDGFAVDAGITQFVELENATDKSLAKMSNFISRSISSQSQSLGTGGPSKTLSI